jgi:hypothetical protein
MLDKMKEIQKKATGAADEAAEKARGVAEGALEKVNQLLEDFYDVLPVLQGLGLSIGSVRMKFGVVPEVRAMVTGALDAIDEERIKELMASKPENKVLRPIIQAFRTLIPLKKPLGAVGFKSIKVDLTVGTAPDIEMEFLR